MLCGSVQDCGLFGKPLHHDHKEIAIVSLAKWRNYSMKFREVLQRTSGGTEDQWRIWNYTGPLDINETFQGEMRKMESRGVKIENVRLTPQRIYT